MIQEGPRCRHKVPLLGSSKLRIIESRMPLTEVVEEPSVFKPQDDAEKHCRCYKGAAGADGHTHLVDDIESVSLQKSTYYSRVSSEYTQNRIVKGGLKIPKKGFRTLRDECLKAKKLYEDPEFPPNDYSIAFNGVTRRSYVWKRPHVSHIIYGYLVLNALNKIFDLQEQKIITPLIKPHLQNALAIMNKTLSGVASTAGVTSNLLGMFHLPQSLVSLTNWNLSMAFPEGKAELIRLHNPWGNETEWKGSWSDKSPEWATITEEEKKRLGLTFDDDGEFWMSFQDFVKNFTTVEVCDVTPEVFDHNSFDEENGNENQVDQVQKRWQMMIYEGAWASHHSAGGCRNFINTFASNPQYSVQLEDPDVDDDDDLCTIVVSLMQKNVRQLKRYGVDYVPIGFTIYKLPPDMQPEQKLDTEFFKYNPSIAKVPFFLNSREVTTRFRFPPGTYVIIPSTFEPEMTGEFLLRIFTEAKRK
nr:calpain-B-like [Cherax quadricarinatus]